MKEKIRTTTVCKFCNGEYYSLGSCPKFGLKHRNTFCVDQKVSYAVVRKRNDVPWYKFWVPHYTLERTIINQSN
jgi:hypothetical protein